MYSLEKHYEKHYGVPRDEVAKVIGAILDFPGLVHPHRDAVKDALAFWPDHRRLSIADCMHLATTCALGLAEIYTFDRNMDRYPGVDRVEPEA